MKDLIMLKSEATKEIYFYYHDFKKNLDLKTVLNSRNVYEFLCEWDYFKNITFKFESGKKVNINLTDFANKNGLEYVILTLGSLYSQYDYKLLNADYLGLWHYITKLQDSEIILKKGE